MATNCFRCGQPAFATLKVEATVGETWLKISGEAGETGICAACMIELAKWFESGRQNGQNDTRAAPATSAVGIGRPSGQITPDESVGA